MAPLARHGRVAGASLEIRELLLGVVNERFRRGGARFPRRPLALAGRRIGARARLVQDGFGGIDLRNRGAERRPPLLRLQLVDVLRKHAGKVCVCELVPQSLSVPVPDSGWRHPPVAGVAVCS